MLVTMHYDNVSSSMLGGFGPYRTLAPEIDFISIYVPNDSSSWPSPFLL